MIKSFQTILFVVFSAIILSGQGTVRGTITDGTTGETIPFANVLVAETQTGTTSDLDGVYELSLEAGTYNVEFSFLGYSTSHVSDIIVEEGKVNVLDIVLEEESEVLEEVVIKAATIKNTEAAILTIQRKSPNLLDGISSQTFRKIGDSDAASAIKRVTGVSVEGGKYVYVRGLGDRYTKNTLNGMEIPGLDPDRNTVQMDLFPSNLIDNIIVLKTFTPDQPGDFTGGLVDIITKSFPDEETLDVSVGFGYNPQMNLNRNFLSHKVSSTDKFGFDNGQRQLPYSPNQIFPLRVKQSPLLSDLTRQFNSSMASQRRNSFLDQSYSLAYGNQYSMKGGLKVGFNLALNYKNDITYYDEVFFGDYIKPTRTESELLTSKTTNGELGNNNVLLSGLMGVALKAKNHKVSLDIIRIQNGESQTAKSVQEEFIFNQTEIDKTNLEYAERSITNILLKTKHSFFEDKFNVEFKVAPTLSRVNEPDIRFTSYLIDEDTGNYQYSPSDGAQTFRVFRNLEEKSIGSRIDLTNKFTIGGRDSKVKYGLNGTYKERTFNIYNYEIGFFGSFRYDFTGNPDEFFFDENVYDPDDSFGSFVSGNFQESNQFEANQLILAGYAMHEAQLSDRFRVIYGARYEKTENKYTGVRSDGSDRFDNRTVLDVTDILPSANVVYSFNDMTNFRASFSSTVARPSFKEKSTAQIQDRISGRTFIGNLDLERTNINNFDLRWEKFMSGGQIVSVSGFYKGFKNPIELVSFDDTAPNNFTPRNVGDASVLGLELEVRKKLDFTNDPILSRITMGLNVTAVKSHVQMNDAEFESRSEFAREGEQIDRNRQMVGQSPFIINGLISYNGLDNGWESTLSYNVQGKRLAIVGIGQVPDVYESSFHSLNLKVSKKIGRDYRWRASVKMDNILDDNKQKVFQSYQATDQIFENFNPSRTFSLSLGYRM